MMLALRDLQSAFAAHLRGEDMPELAAEIGDVRRLEIHRHHVAHSLAAALAVSFPTVHALVGAGFFRRIAGAFVARGLPTQPVLAEYGVDFADFLDTQEAVHGLAYLADVARLDWALNRAYYGLRGRCLTPADLADAAPEQLASAVLPLAAGTMLLRSRYPLGLIWVASQPGAPEGQVDLAQGPARLLVLPRPHDAGFIALEEGEASFVAAVADGRSLEIAAAAGFAADRGFELAPCFARLLGEGAFAAAQQ